MKLISYSVEIHHGPDCECTDESLSDYTDNLPTPKEVEDAIYFMLNQRRDLLDAPVTIKVSD